MLHAKFQDHRTSGSGEEDFLGIYHIWAWRPSWSCDLDQLYKHSFALSKEAQRNIGFDWQSGFRGEKFEIVDGRMGDDGRRRTQDAGPLISYEVS